MTKIAIIGLGHWGPHYLRNFLEIEQCEVIACADLNRSRLETYRKYHPKIHFYDNISEIFKKEKPDATIIATPTSTHYEIALSALKEGQHLLIEKPFCLEEKHCLELSHLAKTQKKILMVGHTFLYNDAVVHLKNYITSGEAGKIYYLHATRTNLGPIRPDVNSLLDLAPHDISIFLYLLNKKPEAVSAHGAAFLNPQREDVTFLTLYFDEGLLGHIHVSWLDPRKVRQVTVVGDKRMFVFDDINVFEPIRIYDKGVKQPKEFSDFSQFKAILYEGDVVIPKISTSEPLKNQCKAFLGAIRSGKLPLSDGNFGIDVCRVLIGAMKSLRQNGKIILL